MSRRQPNAYTQEDIAIVCDAAGVAPDAQLRIGTSMKDVIAILCKLNGLHLVDIMPETNPSSGAAYTPGAFSNALLPSVLPSYKLTPDQLEGIGKQFSADTAKAAYERRSQHDSRAENERFARALNDTYQLDIVVPPPKKRAAPKPHNARGLSFKDREIFSFIRADMLGEGMKGTQVLFPNGLGLEPWLEVVLQETGKTYADVVKNTSNEGADGYQKLIKLDKLDFEIVAENITRIVKGAPEGIKGLQIALELKAADLGLASGVATNV